MNKITIFLLLLALGAAFPPAFAGEGHEHEESSDSAEHGAEEEEGVVTLAPEAIEEAGIVVEPLRLQNIENEVVAPGEVRLNSYLSSQVTPRITAQVVSRHAKLGDKVEKGQVLLTLSSVEVAQAVGDFLVAHKEWKRVKQLGASAVSAKRYAQARINYTQARAKLLAYGLTEPQLQELKEKKNVVNPGEFQLLAMQDGVIVSDDFIEGELIEPGRVLFNIVNEDVLWVESRLSPQQAENITVGAGARVRVPGNGWLQGKVIQKHHMLDEETRTIGVRIEVGNEADKLHPGMFVETRIQTSAGGGKKYLAVPTEAVLRSPDGDWVVFVEQDSPGKFKPQEVEIVRVIDDYTVISGIAEGTSVVTSGAFFVQSELAKSGFSVHNH